LYRRTRPERKGQEAKAGACAFPSIMPLMSSSPEYAATCVGVVKIYWTATGEVHALKGIDAAFPAGAVTAVVGPSGSGKSSLLRMLAGLDRPSAGSVEIDGTELAGLSARGLRRLRRRQIGYVFQRPSENLIPYLTVGEHLQLAARLRGLRRVKGADLLERLGLGHREDHLPHQLSGGEQQRAAFAQAVVGTPALVVADEPTAELDSRTGRDLLDLVHSLAGEGLAAFVLATHDVSLIDMADRTFHLRHGAMEAESGAEGMLSVIDETGRIQLPPQALRLFPRRRAVIRLEEGQVRIDPP
jgi:putative ABC transport system ATP-binding protein